MSGSNFSNMTSMTEFFTTANDVGGGYLVYALVVVGWVALFASTISFGRSRALTFTSFTMGILMLFLNIAGLMDYWLLIVDMIFLSIGVLMLVLTKREGG